MKKNVLVLAAKYVDLCIIEDIAHELTLKQPRFKQCHYGTKSGSILCYPVHLQADTTKTALVVSIYSPKSGHFQNQKKDSYAWILDQFGARLGLGCCLYYIKQQID